MLKLGIKMVRLKDIASYVGLGFFALSLGLIYGSSCFSNSVRVETKYSRDNVEIVESGKVGNRGFSAGAGLSALVGAGFYTVGAFKEQRD